ncbi:hypothetical protein [Bdellovibrio sp. HCB2-146]|uniref:hypothetical protein n=1 Tax=Bdellovibrio sp. HCB2-146 TaxID=3394362 RepID=UPI0039BCCC24
MIRALFVAAVLPLIALSAHAQETVIVQKRSAVVEESSSEHNRMGKKYVVAAQLFGVGVAQGSGQGVVAGYHLDRNTVVQLEVLSGVRKDGIFENYELKTNSVGIHAKKFVSNSFYVNGGLDYSTIKYDNDYIFTTSSNKDAYGFEATMLSAGFVIGNQWQWESFTLGCDWVGLTLPLSHSISSEYADASYTNAKKYNKEDQDTLLANGSAQLLRFYVGATF